MKKRMISTFLCAWMVLSSMGGAVFAAEEAVAVEEAIAEEMVPSVDEFEVGEPHPLEGIVTEEVPNEMETSVEGEMESEPAEDFVDVDAPEGEEEDPAQMPVPGIIVTPGMTEEELIALIKSQPPIEYVDENYGEAPAAGTLSDAEIAGARSVVYSSNYASGVYYSNLKALTLGGGQLSDFVQIAMSQNGYYNCPTPTDLSGENRTDSKVVNNSEYGWYFDLTSYAWNAMFVNWCARIAGISTVVIPHNTVTDEGAFGPAQTDFENIQKGDIVYVLGSDGYRRIGIVYSVDSDTIYTIEGQRGRYGQVGYDKYAIDGDEELKSYTSPDYLDSWDYISGAWYFRDADGTMKTGWFQRTGYWYYLDPEENGKMAIGWKEIEGAWYYFRPAKNGNGPQGSRVTGWVDTGSNWYYLDPNDFGKMAVGWRSVYSSGYAKNYTYYFLGSGEMVTGTQIIDGKTYTFSDSGALIG